jgi:tetratricopeptide (TPR) repeat protein
MKGTLTIDPGPEALMNPTRRICLVTLLLSVAACTQISTVRDSPDAAEITVEMLLDASPLAPDTEMPDLSGVDMLELTPGMIDFVEENVEEGLSPRAKLKNLLYAVIGDENFELVYDDSTRTASGTFEERHGNCLSFTNMFVAMARSVGLDARYQEVEIAPDWSSSGQSYLLSQHVNVYVDFHGEFTPQIVDFNFSYEPNISLEFDLPYDREVISDNRARAHYFNNLGVEHMLYGGETPAALANYRQSLIEDETFTPAWINLGILYRRDGWYEYAQAAYMNALVHDNSNLVAMSNLAALFEQQGDVQQAEHYRQLVQRHRMKNPYYRYSLAQQDVIEGNYASARSHLKYAIKRRDSESRFYVLMSISYAMSGDQAAAGEWMAQAEELAGENDSRRYRHKLDMLMSLEAKQ